MILTAEQKKGIFSKFGKNENDSGTTEGQIALFTERIQHLTEHLKANRKDFGTQHALLAMVGKRRALLDYLKKKDIEKYRALIKELGIRK